MGFSLNPFKAAKSVLGGVGKVAGKMGGPLRKPMGAVGGMLGGKRGPGGVGAAGMAMKKTVGKLPGLGGGR